MMTRFATIVYLITFTAFIGFSNVAFAQCTSVIPGLPNVGSVPCNEPFTPNTPSDPSDGPNAAGSPSAAKHANDTCDGDFMNQIYARSYLEANRELMIGEVLVLKPDSVLEYSCFDGQVKRTAETAGLIFSETNLWLASAGGAYSTAQTSDGTDIELNVYLLDTYVDLSLNRLIMQSLYHFVNSNFSHDFLGGTAGVDSDVKAAVGAAKLACSNMRDVYELARCDNVNQTLMFRKFSDLVSNDPRETLPGNLKCGALNPITTEAIAVANNDDGEYAFKDNLVPYHDVISIKTGNTCYEHPIATGLWVKQEKFTYGPSGSINLNASLSREFAEYVCPTPGCYYEPAGAGTCKDKP